MLFEKKCFGFTLMEMMIVLLIVAIIAAATAPMVTKKMARSSGTGDSPWVFTGDRNSIAFIPNNSQVLIGASKVPSDATQAKLYIAGAEDWSHIRFGNENNSSSLGITANPGTSSENSAIGISNANISNGSIMFGVDQSLLVGSTSAIGIGNGANIASNSIAIGNDTESTGTLGITIGKNSKASNKGAIAIGANDGSVANNNSNLTSIQQSSYKKTSATGISSISIGTNATSVNSSSISMGSSSYAGSQGSVSIGDCAYSKMDNTIAVGKNAKASGTWSTALGYSAKANNSYSVAIGPGAETSNSISLAVGYDAKATGYTTNVAIGPHTRAQGSYSAAIGYDATATHSMSTAIGYNATTTANNQIVLGDTRTTVYIPGNLVVGTSTFLGSRQLKGQCLTFFYHKTEGKDNWHIKNIEVNSGKNDDFRWGGYDWTRYFSSRVYSDIRLKNVGEKYGAGIEELKKLDSYNFTFKDDDEKTPHVGVIAQDLQKVFPDAVTKGEDGYLRIRMEDMFYAVINAVKELDLKITSIVDKVDNLVKDIIEVKSTIENQQKMIENQQRIIEAQDKAIKDLQKKVNKK